MNKQTEALAKKFGFILTMYAAETLRINRDNPINENHDRRVAAFKELDNLARLELLQACKDARLAFLVPLLTEKSTVINAAFVPIDLEEA